MTHCFSTERVRVLPNTDPLAGQVVWVPTKSIWFSCHLALTLITICAGYFAHKRGSQS